jgi:PAS domain S-box-containing protein
MDSGTHAGHLRLLIAEDSERDAELLQSTIEQAGYDADYHRVQTAEAFRDALATSTWDIILSDHSMPGFSAIAALQLLRERKLDLPLIIVCGKAGEEVAVAAMKAGANDYITKDNLTRLVPVIERELREAEDRRRRRVLEREHGRLAAMVDSADDAMIGTTRDGIITSWNRGAVGLYGHCADEAIGQSITLLVPVDRREESQRLLEQVTRGDRVRRFETVRVRKDGTRAALSVTISPVEDVDGTIVGASVIARDVTERDRSAQALRQSEERYRTIFGSAPIGMLVADTDGRFVMANQAFQRLVGYTEDELYRMRFTDITHPADLDVGLGLFRQAMTGVRPGYEMTKRYVRKDGMVVWVRLTTVVLHDAEGNPRFGVGMVQAISEGERRLLSLGVEAVVSLVGERVEEEHRVHLLGARDAWRTTPIAALTGWERAFEHSISASRDRMMREGLEAAYRAGRTLSFGEIADLTLALLNNYVITPTSREPAQEQQSGHSVLSRREHEVLQLIAHGLGNKAIAKELGVSPGTISYHLSNIFNKLGVHNRAQAVAVAHQWVSPSDT